MASTIQLYNHTVNKFNSGSNDVADTYKVMLLDDSAAFDATDTTIADVDTNEVYGNGWPLGGFTLTSVTIAIDDTDGSKFDAADVSQLISGGTLGPYYKIAIYNASDADALLAFITLESAITITSGNNAAIQWNTNGIVSWAVA